MNKPFRRQLPGIFRKYIPHLDVRLLCRLTGDPTKRGINCFDASLLQYLDKEQQLPLWKIVKHVRDPMIRFHVIRKILARMKIEIILAVGVVNMPENPTLPSHAEVEEIINNII